MNVTLHCRSLWNLPRSPLHGLSTKSSCDALTGAPLSPYIWLETVKDLYRGREHILTLP